MKRKTKVFAILITAMLVASLCLVALVACNDSDKSKSKRDDDDLLYLTDVISKKDLESMIGFAISNESGAIFVNYTSNSFEGENSKYGKTMTVISVSGEINGREKSFTRYIFDSASAARAYLEDGMIGSYPDEPEYENQFALEGKSICQGDKEFFTDIVLKSSIPKEYSRERLAFIRECEKESGVYFYLRYTVYDGEEDWHCNFIKSADTNCTVAYQFMNDPGNLYTSEINKILANYTEDSYYDFTRESGYVFIELTTKLGFTYKDYGEGLAAEEYYYDKNSPKDVVVPAQANGKNVLSFGLDAGYYGSRFSSPYARTITLSEGIVRWDCRLDDSPKLVSISLPSSLRQLPKVHPFANCPKFSAIEYAGTIDEWNALIEENGLDMNDWCHYYYYDDDYEAVSVDMPITVKCSNGDLTYPTAA